MKNITRYLQEALQDTEIWKDFECSDPENYVPNCYDEVEYDYDDFKDFQKRLEKFKKSLKVYKEGSEDSFYFAILCGAFFNLNETKHEFTKNGDKLKSVLGVGFLSALEKKRVGLYLD